MIKQVILQGILAVIGLILAVTYIAVYFTQGHHWTDAFCAVCWVIAGTLWALMAYFEWNDAR